LFLDLDDVLCHNHPYGGYDVVTPGQPADLWEKLFHQPAVEVLTSVVRTHSPAVVLTTSWLRLIASKELFLTIFRNTGMESVAEALHEKWEATPAPGENRQQAIARWLEQNHKGEPFAIVDDPMSGEGLQESHWYSEGRVIMCQPFVGLQASDAAPLERALKLPATALPARSTAPNSEVNRAAPPHLVITYLAPLLSLQRRGVLDAIFDVDPEVQVVVSDFVRFQAEQQGALSTGAAAIVRFLAVNAAHIAIMATGTGSAYIGVHRLQAQAAKDPEVAKFLGVTTPAEAPAEPEEMVLIEYLHNLSRKPVRRHVFLLANEAYLDNPSEPLPPGVEVLSAEELLNRAAIMSRDSAVLRCGRCEALAASIKSWQVSQMGIEPTNYDNCECGAPRSAFRRCPRGEIPIGDWSAQYIRASRPSEALAEHREQVLAILATSSTIRNPRIFGSVARGEDTLGSDLDILVDADRGTTLIDLARLQLELEELLGVPVDVLTPGDLKEKVRLDVLAEAKPL
jgi:predicted nucleotidyltransferase